MKFIVPLIFTILLNAVIPAVLAPHKETKKERRLLFGPSKTEQLEEKTRTQRKIQQLNLTVATMDRETEIRELEGQMNEIGNSVEEINETMNSKLSEFTDMIERLRYQKMSQPKFYRINGRG